MKTLYFECKLLSDTILTFDSASEGNSPCLDYIPGMNFLGITAKQYDKLKANDLSFSLFHSGKVRFNDAHIAINDQRCLPVPLPWYVLKGTELQTGAKIKSKDIIVDYLRKEDEKELPSNKKQIRKGYFSPQGEYILPRIHFTQKSAYDMDKRRSKESAMFGYHALRRGQTYIFTVELHTGERLDELKTAVTTALEGDQTIGRSRSAQYGKVKIRQLKINNEIITHGDKLFRKKYLVLYADSPLFFYSENGEPTLTPTYRELLLNNPGFENTDMAKSKGDAVFREGCRIRSRVYAPWNGKRYNRDNDRICMEKGSVIVLDTDEIEGFNLEQFKEICREGIGFYRNEGMGKILINPSFLDPDITLFKDIPAAASLTGDNELITSSKLNHESDKAVIGWINRAVKQKKADEEILSIVCRFVAKNKHEPKWQQITPSQWGQVRSIVQGVESNEEITAKLFSEKEGYLRNGVAQSKWKNCYEEIMKLLFEKEDSKAIKIAILLATEMAKQVSVRKEDNHVSK